ncbi:DUF4209 domain-containing protein [soil metagenome]
MAEEKIPKPSLEVAIGEIESKQFKYDFQIADEFKKLTETDSFTADELECIKAEFMLFRFMTKNDFEDNIEPRFKPIMEFTNGTVFPDYSELTPERLNYYLERSKITTNPVMKARYLDISYEFNKKIKKESILGGLIESHIEAAKVEGRGNEMDSIDLVQRAFIVAFNHKTKQPMIFEKAKMSVFDFLKKLQAENPRWCLELLELIVHFNKVFNPKEINHAHIIAKEGVKYYKNKEGSFLILESYIKIEHEIDQLLNPNTFDPQQAAREVARLYSEEAHDRNDSPFIKQTNLLKAAQILRDAGLNSEAAKLNEQAEKLGTLSEFTDGFKEFAVEQTIPKEVFKNLQDELSNHNDKPGLIAYSQNFFPSWKQAKQEAKSEKYDSLSDHFTSTTYNKDNMPIAIAPDDITYRKTMRYYDISVAMSELFLHATLKEVIKDSKLTLKDILPQINKIKLINKDTYEAVLLGFKYFFKGKYYEALSILIPQIEDLLGDIVKVHGMKRYRQKDVSVMEPKMLGSLLNDLERLYSRDLARFIEYKLINPAKDNLRNITGHGGLKPNTPNLDKKAMVVLQIYMAILLQIKTIPVKTKTK